MPSAPSVLPWRWGGGEEGRKGGGEERRRGGGELLSESLWLFH